MLTQFSVFHRQISGATDLVLPQGFWHLKTCLRSIVLTKSLEKPVILDGYDHYQDEKAYEFLLQIICGLHSPLIGETEILGQFKGFVKQSSQFWDSEISALTDRLFKDSKTIRTQYLQNLGCTSYGSLLRKRWRNESGALHFLGAGSLVADILPWVQKANGPISVFTRNPEKYRHLNGTYPDLKLQPLDDIPMGGGGACLIIAAPLSREKIESMLSLNSYEQVFDLRGESANDPLHHQGSVVNLADLFSSIENNRIQAEKMKAQALQRIRESACEFSLHERPRPFGWEDLWVYA